MSTKAYASAYQSDRVCPASMVQGEVRKLEVDFNGALNGETITAVELDAYALALITLSGLTQANGIVSVVATAVLYGCQPLRFVATTSGGRKLAQWFEVEVTGWMPQSAALTWTAP